MNRFLKGFAISAVVALFTVASAGVASAGDRGHGKHYGGKHYGYGKHYGGKHHGYGKHYGGRRHGHRGYYYGFAGIVGHLLYGGYSRGHRYGYGSGYDYGRGYSRRHDHRRHGHGGYQRKGYSQNYRPQYGYKTHNYAVQKPCHATSKDGYAHGRRARIGGTMCYDNYGNAYIVAGSRHVIGYY